MLWTLFQEADEEDFEVEDDDEEVKIKILKMLMVKLLITVKVIQISGGWTRPVMNTLLSFVLLPVRNTVSDDLPILF